MGFIEEIAPLVQKHIGEYGIKVSSSIIAQAVLESASGTSPKAKHHNYFGLKYRENRITANDGYFYDGGSEQNKDGTYTPLSDTVKWYNFSNIEQGVLGYLQFINTPNYANLKGVTDPRTYLELIKKDGYATSLKYVDNLMAIIKKYDLTKYDNMTTVEKVENMGYKLYTKLAHISNHGGFRQTSDIQYIVLHYTANKTDLASSNANYFQSANRKASAHYFVDKTSVYQSVEDNVVAWSVGGKKYADCNKTGGGKYYNICTNTNSISIELCSDNGEIAKETIDNAIELTKSLMAKYNIPQSNVIRHFDVTGKKCIGWNGWLPTTNESKWNDFKSRLTTTSNPLIYDGLDYSLVFDLEYYCNTHQDVSKALGMTLAPVFNHFITYGMKEGRQATKNFSVQVYKSIYKDLRDAFGNDLPKYYKHYITNGHKEGRLTI